VACTQNRTGQATGTIMKRRLDRLSAILIEAILTNRPFYATQAVARVFAANNIPIDIALRVITRPQERRKAAAA